MPYVSPALAKSKKREAKREAKNKRSEEMKAWQRLQAEEAAVIQRQKEYLAHMEATILAEVDRKMQEYIEGEQQRLAESEHKKHSDLEGRRGNAVELKKQSFPLLNGMEGAKSILNEVVLSKQEKWTIHRKDLGRGNYAVIYQADDPVGRSVACKITILKALPSDYKARIMKSLPIQRFIKEHGHPMILPIHEIYLTQEKLYIFEDAMKTDLLKKIKTEGPLDEIMALRIAKDVGEGVAYLHSIGVAHERIRPGHVLLDEAGNAKICGLGWCSVFFDPEKGQLIPQQGSRRQKFHHFFAPEVMRDKPYDPSMADVWALGTLLNIMLTKEWPFQQKNSHPLDIVWKLSFKKAGVELTDRVYQILSKCYVEKPEQRGDIFSILDAFPSDAELMPLPEIINE
jgi:hypothetical protein